MDRDAASFRRRAVQIKMFPMQGDGKLVDYSDGEAAYGSPTFSPDGRYMAYFLHRERVA
jgi:tricorn protease-like protein